MTVIKNVISPIQMWLMSQGRCVGCGKEIGEQKREKLEKHSERVTCSCGRVFIYDTKKGSYRRALFEEA